MSQIIIESPEQITDLEGAFVHVFRSKEVRKRGDSPARTVVLLDLDAKIVNGRVKRLDKGKGRPASLKVGDRVTVIPAPEPEA